MRADPARARLSTLSFRAMSLAVVASLIGGCLAIESPPTPQRASGEAPSVSIPPPPREAGVLALAVQEDPLSLLPVGDDPATARVTGFLYDPLYRLDARLQPVPAVASALPTVVADGLTWQVPLRRGVRFHDGSPLRPSDAVTTIELARSAHCPFQRAVCAAAGSITAVAAADDAITLGLAAPFSPLLATVLARLPLLPDALVRAQVEELMARVRPLGRRPVELAERIAAETNAEACLSEAPPATCDVASYAVELEALLRSAGVAPPDAARYRDEVGALDGDAYAAALLEDVQALARALPAEGFDRLAAALPLTGLASRPVGSGPFAFGMYRTGDHIALVRHGGHLPEAAAVAALRISIVRDPAAAATALRAGTLDWLPRVSPEQVPELERDPTIRVGAHADGALRLILFNVRPGRVYDRVETRRAFALCIDKAAAAADATSGRALVASGVTAPYGWAAPPTVASEPDVATARALLASAGWEPGPDGVMTRGEQRLSSTVHVRPSRGDLLAFARFAGEHLLRCGIELTVRELDLTGDTLLRQLRYPNDFDTVLVSRELGVDPDTDLAAFESSHITTAEDPGDSNAGGWSSEAADGLLASARATPDQAQRAALYARLHALLAAEMPAYPIWYEVGFSALSRRVSGPQGEIDLTSPLHDAGVAEWQVVLP